MERKDIVLNNGVTMPPIGYGAFRMTDLEECENAVVSFNHQLQESEAFQSVHQVTFILCYTVLYNFLGLRYRFGRHRTDVHWTSCALVFALIRVRKH